MSQLLLGFDTLAAAEVVIEDSPWGLDGREAFLLRPEIKSPVSVDRLVCPSIFQPEVQHLAETKIILTRFSPSLGVNRAVTRRIADWPEADLNILGLWTDISKMLLWTAQKPELKKLIRFPIAIQILLEPPATSDPLWLTVADSGSKPSSRSDGWPLLGYDVADEGRISALSDCSYENDEISEARLRWSGCVNNWGLLDDFASAAAFQGFSNTRVVEHAPFYIYTVFKIPEESGG